MCRDLHIALTEAGLYGADMASLAAYAATLGDVLAWRALVDA